MVLAAFVGPRPSAQHMALHSDDDPWNNNVDNLRWGTAKDNAADRSQNGWSKARATRPRAHFTDRQVQAIRALVAGGVSQSALAEALGVQARTVQDVTARRTYK